MLKSTVWISLFFSMALYAHPHIFATAFLSVAFEPSGELVIKNRWVFDELYSAAKVESIGAKKKGEVSKDEALEIERSVVQMAQRFNYYNYLLVGSQFLAANDYKNLVIKREGKNLAVYFDLIFDIKAKDDYTIITLAVKDLSTYIDIDLDINKVKVDAPANIEVEYFTDVLKGLTLFKAFPPTMEGLYLRFRKKP